MNNSHAHVASFEEVQGSERFEPETPFLDTRFADEAWAQHDVAQVPAGEHQSSPQT